MTDLTPDSSWPLPKPDPKELPRRTYWPMFLALSITTAVWGLITSWVVICVSGVAILISIAGWAREESTRDE